MAIFKDDFNRAAANLEDSPISSSGHIWSWDQRIDGAAVIGDGILHCGTLNTGGSTYWAVDHSSKNHYVQFDVVSTNDTASSFWCCRLADHVKFIGVRAGNASTPGQVEVWASYYPIYTNLYSSPGGTVSIGDTVRMEVQDTTYTVYVNDVQLTTGTIGDDFDPLEGNTKSGVVPRAIMAGIGDNFETGRIGQVDILVDTSGSGGISDIGSVEVFAGTGISTDVTGSEATAFIGDIALSIPASVSLTGEGATGSVGSETVTAIRNLSFDVAEGFINHTHLGTVSIVGGNILSVEGLQMQAFLGTAGFGRWVAVLRGAEETWTKVNPYA